MYSIIMICATRCCLCISVEGFIFAICGRGHAVAQLVEALRYKPEGRRFDSRWCHWNFSLCCMPDLCISEDKQCQIHFVIKL